MTHMIDETGFDWSGCPEVEQIPGKVSGVPILVGTRVMTDAVTNNYDSGCPAEEVAEMFQLDPEQVKAVIDFYQQRRAATDLASLGGSDLDAEDIPRRRSE